MAALSRKLRFNKGMCQKAERLVTKNYVEERQWPITETRRTKARSVLRLLRRKKKKRPRAG